MFGVKEKRSTRQPARLKHIPFNLLVRPNRDQVFESVELRSAQKNLLLKHSRDLQLSKIQRTGIKTSNKSLRLRGLPSSVR